MASYEIYNTDNSKKYTVNENSTNRETSVTMIGHGMPEYGVDQNTNFLHLLENSASMTEPQNPIVGQLWFKKLDNEGRYELKICKKTTGNSESENWDKLAIVYTANTRPLTPSTGEMWYDTETHSLKVYDEALGGDIETKWNKIGPDDIAHKEVINESQVINENMEVLQTTYKLPQEIFAIDVENDGDDKEPSGSLSMVTLKILAKEIFTNITSTRKPRAAGWIYKFLIQAYKEGPTHYKIDMVGRESYELIGMTENTSWMVDFYKSGSDFIIKVQDNSGELLTDSRIVIGYDLDIVRV